MIKNIGAWLVIKQVKPAYLSINSMENSSRNQIMSIKINT